jgi:hypothetical protein
MVRCPICKQLVTLDTDGFHGRMIALDADRRIHPHPEAAAPAPLEEEVEYVPRRVYLTLEPDQVMEILSSDERHEDIALRYGISVSSVYAVWKGERHPVPGFDYQALAQRRAALAMKFRKQKLKENWRNQQQEAA